MIKIHDILNFQIEISQICSTPFFALVGQKHFSTLLAKFVCYSCEEVCVEDYLCE